MTVAARPKLATKRRSGRPPSDVAARLPILLLDAAQELFLSQGYGATTVEQVASRIGATKRTIYSKFGDKAGLFAATSKRLVESRRTWLAGDPVGETVDDRLINFGSQLLSLVLAPEILALHRVIIAESQRFPELVALVDQLAAQGVRRRLTRVLKAEMDRGTLIVANLEVAAELLVGMIINSAIHASLLGVKPTSTMRGSRWVEAAVSMFLEGCRNRQGPDAECGIDRRPPARRLRRTKSGGNPK